MTLTASQFQECIRHMFCIGQATFIQIWGEESGDPLWEKFDQTFDRDIAKFICYLDSNNLRLLFKHFEDHLEAVKRL